MRLIFFGSAEFGVPCLRAMRESGAIDLAHIFTQPARKAGRGRKLIPTPVAVWADENGVPYTEAENINSPEMIEKIAACKAELLVVIAFGQFISGKVIDLHKYRAINVHGSLLPKYRGAGPIYWPIINGDAETGITIITVEKKMDTGDMLGHASIAIEDDDDAQSIHDKLSEISPPVLIDCIKQIAAGTAVYTPQDDSQATQAPKLQKSDGFISWADTAESINNRIRGLWPWPGVQADFVSQATGKSCRVTIAKAKVVSCSGEEAECGTINGEGNIVCGDGCLKVMRIKPAGGKVMDFKSFVNGRAVCAGDVFKSVECDK
ncbi:MAG: methionyl-tRNA formyltransferase [Planctomycetes bacterium]|nr:methionyl-tRNA formyltransferase [Planctomycetota bacterium]